jgi:hypothetical protein
MNSIKTKGAKHVGKSKETASNEFYKKLFALFAIVLFSLAIAACGGNPTINAVKEAYFDDNPDIKIGDAYVAFFANPK